MTARPNDQDTVRPWRKRAARACLAACLAAAPASGQDAVSGPRPDAAEFVMSNAQFVLLHELAHLVIDEKNVPVLGPEELAADYIAAMMLIRPRRTPPQRAEALLTVAAHTAEGFALAWRQREQLGQAVPYWDTHALTAQRFSTLACLLYGSDPERFAHLPQLVEMPAQRARGCREEYERAAYAIDWLIDTYGRAEADPPGAPLEVRIEPPPTLTSQRLLEAIQKQGFIDRTVAVFSDLVTLDEPATFVMRRCGEPQAAWIPATRELVFCYELLDAYALMSGVRTGAVGESLTGQPP